MVDRRRALAWLSGHRVSVRQVNDYDAETDDIKPRFEESRDVKWERFVAVPDLGALAVSDQSGENHIGARQAITRFQTVFENTVPGGEADIRLSASREDVDAAISAWRLEEFSFTVRPFNPSVRRQGRKLHEALEREKIASLRAVARARAGEALVVEEGDLLSDAVGLARAGYGQIGFKGKTATGQDAQFKKPTFSPNRQENEDAQDTEQALRVLIEPQLSDMELFQEVTRALIEFYDRDD